MKTLIFLLPVVICFDNYYIANKKDLLVWGNKSTTQVNKVNWYEAENGVFKNMSIALRRISADACPTIYYCQYEEYINEYTSFTTADLFIVNCPASTTLKGENFHQFHETRGVSRVVKARFNRLTRVSNVEPFAYEDE